MVGTWLWVVSLPDATFKGWGQGQAFQIRPYRALQGEGKRRPWEGGGPEPGSARSRPRVGCGEHSTRPQPCAPHSLPSRDPKEDGPGPRLGEGVPGLGSEAEFRAVSPSVWWAVRGALGLELGGAGPWCPLCTLSGPACPPLGGWPEPRELRCSFPVSSGARPGPRGASLLLLPLPWVGPAPPLPASWLDCKFSEGREGVLSSCGAGAAAPGQSCRPL